VTSFQKCLNLRNFMQGIRGRFEAGGCIQGGEFFFDQSRELEGILEGRSAVLTTQELRQHVRESSLCVGVSETLMGFSGAGWVCNSWALPLLADVRLSRIPTAAPAKVRNVSDLFIDLFFLAVFQAIQF
jgi:hypothetical protein